jgi:hypothetical protein
VALWLQVPLMMMQQKAHITISNTLGLQGYNSIDMTRWQVRTLRQARMCARHHTCSS